MKLENKKALAKRALKVGIKRIVFLKPRLGEIKEAITKQDIKGLYKEGAIIIKEKKGKRTKKGKKKKRSTGNIRKKVNKRKQEYMILTRKLRKYIAEMKKQGKLSRDEVINIRKKIRNRIFKSKANLKEYLGVTKK